MFKNIKLAFYDFDRTLCVHTYPSDDLGKAHFDYEQECYLQYHMQKQVLQGDMPVEYMRWFVNHVSESTSGSVKQFVLTHEIFSLRDDYKKGFAKRHYGIDGYISTNSSEHKIEMMRAIAKSENVSLNDVLFVDDKMEIIYNACENGILALHISNVIGMYEKHLKETGVLTGNGLHLLKVKEGYANAQ